MLRANDLIFNYVVSNWLMGQDPPAFDILAWNADSTRMPAAMHAFYLRNFYVENNLAQGLLRWPGGKLINLGDVKHPAYVVGAENDHIVPWRSAYATTRLLIRAGAVRAVAAAVTSPASSIRPAPKAGTWSANVPSGLGRQVAAAGRPATPGSWWEDWADMVGR